MVTIRPAKSSDFFNWLDLFAAYGEFAGTTVSDEKALIVWNWIDNQDQRLHALVAENSDGTLVGFAHYRSFVRPLHATVGLAVDDIFVIESARGAGVAASIVDYVSNKGREDGATVIRLTASPTNEIAQILYDSVAERSDLVVWERAI